MLFAIDIDIGLTLLHWTSTSVSCTFELVGKTGRHQDVFACRPSVCPSVTLVDQNHIGWKSGKLIAGQLAQHLHPS